MAVRLVVLLGVVMSAPPPTPASFAAPSAAPGRSAPVAQPAPMPNPKGTASKQWYVQAVVTRMGTGKATGTVITEKSPKMFAPTEEAAVIKQQEFINEYLHPKKRQKKVATAPPADDNSSAEASSSGSSSAPFEPLPRRASAPTSLAEAKPLHAPHNPRAGPGRGHTFESTRPPEEPEVLPPANATEANWLRQQALKQKWKTEYIAQLERQLLEAKSTITRQNLTIAALREQVATLEAAQLVAAEEIMSYVESAPILKEAAHAKALEEHAEWAEILGVGYSDTQRRDLIYKHLARLLAELRHITGGDATKAKQLSDLLYCRAHTGETRRMEKVDKVAQHKHNVAEAIADSLAEFVHALHDAAGKGAYPGKIKHAQQVLATAVSRAAHYTNTSYKEIGERLGLSPRMISQCTARFDALANDGEWEQLYDDRCAERADKTPSAWRDLGLQYWTDPELGFVRAAESAHETMRNPDDRSDKLPYRKHYLQKGIHEGHTEMLRAGKAAFGDKFHLSHTYFSDLRPFYVKDASRDTCVCVYHMRWIEFADGLRNYRQNLRNHGISKCDCIWPPNEKGLRMQLICPRDGPDHDNISCFLNRCDQCKDARRLFEEGAAPCSLCDDETRDPGTTHARGAATVKFERYEKITYTCKDGTVKEKKDFKSAELPFSEFKPELVKYWPKFIAHDNDAYWHDNDFTALKNKLPIGQAGLVIDFAENFTHEPRIEHQNKYFSQTQTTVVPVVLMFRVEDLTNITDERRAELIAYFDAHNLPHIVSETHFIISADMQHDNAFIRKALDDFIMPYIKRVAPTVTMLHGRSDGCKAQFKCASHFDWVSRQSKEGCRLRFTEPPAPDAPPPQPPQPAPSPPPPPTAKGCVNWSFFESCHGKCYCDPEGGTLKNAARRFEMSGHQGEQGELARAHMLKTSWDFYVWARDKSGLQTPAKALEEKHGKGIFRRFFYWIPAKGVGAVDRSRLPKFASAKGSSRLHEFVDIGVPGTVSTRRAACHKCEQCWAGNRRECCNKDYCGSPMELRIAREAVPTTSLSRVTRASLDADAIAHAATAAVDSTICIETHKDEQTFPWVLGTVVKASHPAPEAVADTGVPHLDAVKAGEPALQVKLWEALEAGSSTYVESNTTILVAARSVRVVKVLLEPVRTSGRGNITGHATACVRFTIHKDSLLQIRAEMPSADDSWEVEAVVQFRSYYRKEQWLVKWKGYGEDRNTWEPWEHLLTEQAQAEARQVKAAALAK